MVQPQFYEKFEFADLGNPPTVILSKSNKFDKIRKKNALTKCILGNFTIFAKNVSFFSKIRRETWWWRRRDHTANSFLVTLKFCAKIGLRAAKSGAGSILMIDSNFQNLESPLSAVLSKSKEFDKSAVDDSRDIREMRKTCKIRETRDKKRACAR